MHQDTKGQVTLDADPVLIAACHRMFATLTVLVPEDYDDLCAICIEPFTADAPPFSLHCGHTFHAKCLRRMAQHRIRQCALCRASLAGAARPQPPPQVAEPPSAPASVGYIPRYLPEEVMPPAEEELASVQAHFLRLGLTTDEATPSRAVAAGGRALRPRSPLVRSDWRSWRRPGPETSGVISVQATNLAAQIPLSMVRMEQ